MGSHREIHQVWNWVRPGQGVAARTAVRIGAPGLGTRVVTGRLKEDRWTSRCLSRAVRGWQGSSGAGGGEAAHLPGLAPDEERCPGLQEAGAPVPEPQFHRLATWGELSVWFPRTSWIFQALITSLPSTCMAPPLPSLGEVSGVLLASRTKQAVEESTLESGQAGSESWFCWTNLGVSGDCSLSY